MRTNDLLMDTTEPHLALPALTDGRLSLRPWQEHDADRLYAAVQESVDSVGRWLPWCRADYGPADAMAWIAHCQAGLRARNHYAFAIQDVTTGELFGSVGLNQFNRLHHSANLGYWVRQSRQRQGIAAAAAALAARFGFEHLQLIRIEIIVMSDNHASRRTAEKIGARFEAIARQRLWANELPHDAAVYALIPADLAQSDAEQSRNTSA